MTENMDDVKELPGEEVPTLAPEVVEEINDVTITPADLEEPVFVQTAEEVGDETETVK